MKDNRFHYKLEENEEAAIKIVAELTEAGPCFVCPYDKAHCDPFCVCSLWPSIRHQGTNRYSIGYRCDNLSLVGDR